MSLLEDGRYQLKGPKGFIKGYRRELFAEFVGQGFEHRLHVDTPTGPEVDQFAKEGKLATLTYETCAGGERLLAVETEEEFPELEDVIVNGAARFLIDTAMRLFAPFNAAHKRLALERLERSFGTQLRQIAPED